MPEIGFPEFLIIILVILLIFGPGRLAKAMGELGKSVRSFREGFSGTKDEEKTEEQDPPGA